MDGARQDVLQDVDDWSMDLKKADILWIHDSPVVGRSAMSSTIASKSGCPGFIFKRDVASLTDPNVVWRRFAFDLASFDPGLKKTVVEILENGMTQIEDVDVEEQFENLIAKPWRATQIVRAPRPPVSSSMLWTNVPRAINNGRSF
jgi:hypothetical protein